MGKGTPIPQYEKATSIPENSTYIADMGDGSGTKGVTQETLTKEVGKGLKVGNLEELQTEDKSSLVAAINEAAQSGGASSVDILDSKEEIEANTESGKAAGALAVKEMFGELNDNLVELFLNNDLNGDDVTLSDSINKFKAIIYIFYCGNVLASQIIPVSLLNKGTFVGTTLSSYSAWYEMVDDRHMLATNVVTESGNTKAVLKAVYGVKRI